MMKKIKNTSAAFYSRKRIDIWDNLHMIFNVLCTLVTLCIVIWWFHKFSLQNLSCSIDIKSFFESDDSLQPAFSVCVTDPELNQKLLKITDSKYNESSYINYLRGIEYNEDLQKLDFSMVRFNWSEYFFEQPVASLISEHGKFLGRVTMGEYWKYSTSFIGLQSNNKYLTDCLSFEPLRKEVAGIRVKLNLSIFDQGIRPSKNHKFRVFVHYPGQIIRSYSSLKSTWDKVSSMSTPYMTFRIKDVQVLQRFPTRRQPCIGDWKNYDRLAFRTILKNVGCQSPYQYIYGSNYSICSTKEKIQQTLVYPSNRQMRRFHNPCKSLYKVQYQLTEWMSTKLPKEVLGITFHFTNEYSFVGRIYPILIYKFNLYIFPNCWQNISNTNISIQLTYIPQYLAEYIQNQPTCFPQ